MNDLDRALAHIVEIRSQIAAGTAFRGYGPATVATTGALALATAAAQALLLPAPSSQPFVFFACWIGVAFLSAAIVWVEMRARSRRHHSALADVMIHQAIEQFLPAAAAGAALAAVLGEFAPDTLWILPGLWQVFVSLGIFASAKTLPKGVWLAGAWYLLAGFMVLIVGSGDHALSPWRMGLPFAIGQSLMAAVLYFSLGAFDGED